MKNMQQSQISQVADGVRGTYLGNTFGTTTYITVRIAITMRIGGLFGQLDFDIFFSDVGLNSDFFRFSV